MHDALEALFLGVVEGLTEFIPVSSTGHLLLVGHFIGFESAGNSFAVMIQLGAVLAVLSVYAARLWEVVRAAPHDPAARRFVASVLIAFLPAVVIGVLAHDLIKTVLFETPRLIALMLILGGVVLLFVDRMAVAPKHDDAMRLPVWTAFRIGLIQCLAMIPGVSRSGATIVGALALGCSKKAAAEFSFFLSMPTMLGAFTYDLYKTRDQLDAGQAGLIAIGFVAAFLSGLCVVRWLLGYVARRGYAIFGWWRIVVGTLSLIALSVWG
ncbi:undecaprenyl-diphosphate phosphatase [Falsirhodobacter sp. 20TX0035]|uniref:undecaprenyl-diphosphate phosphatase n=1 Tax=Falsirhodobacter sp. 20TX0035 TaxID=3022019 RepID=UPI00232F0A2C|nr:undecaprenyl-diphosphate phosphatase [Falsirhodobacter sp. 20TX0035]MDB6454983.1 undecaprenyl-diphosphate phosphatase [Falsirhodobacter sp. 20TX0035]